MKAVYALLSAMLAASLAWAGPGEIGTCDRCEVEDQYQAPRQDRESQRDDLRFDVGLDRNRPDYRPELGIEPSEYDCYGISRGELGEAPSEYDAEGVSGSRVELGIAPSRHDAEGLPQHPELGLAPGNSDVEVDLVAPVPVREFSSSSTGDDGWPPPYSRMIPDAEYDHFWPVSARVLPPLEFDGSNQPNKWKLATPPARNHGSNQPNKWAVEAPPAENCGGQPPLEVELAPVIAE